MVEDPLFQVLLDQTSDGVLVTDRLGRPVRANRRLSELLGLPGSLDGVESVVALLASGRRLGGGQEELERWLDLVTPVPDAASRHEIELLDGGLVECRARPLGGSEGRDGALFVFADRSEERRARRLPEALFAITERAASASDPAMLFADLHRAVGQLMYARNFYVALWDTHLDVVTFPYFVDEFDSTPEPCSTSDGLTGWVIRTGEPCLVDGSDPALGEGIEPRGARPVSWLGVPLRTSDGRVLGSIGVQSYRAEVRFGQDDLDLLSFVSRHIAAMLERRRVEGELRASEKRYRELVEASPFLIGLHYEGRVEFVNRAGAELLGATNPREVIGMQALSFVVPEDRELAARRIGAVRSSMRPIPATKERWRRLDGSRIEVEVVGLPFGHEDDPAILVVARDVTERAQLETDLRRAQKLEVVGRLAGGVAHDFNNLLTAILGYAGLLLGDLAPNDPRRSEVEAISRAGRRAADLTSKLLAFSRRQVLELEDVDLNRVLGEMEGLLTSLLGEKNRLELDLRPAIGPIRADEGQLEQVVLNLAMNARDAMPEGGRLVVSTTRVELDSAEAVRRPRLAAGPYVRLRVVDEGVGMDPTVLEHVFEPFFTTKDVGKGTGLGLASVYGIVKQCGGEIEVESRLGEGTTFSVYFPELAVSVAEPPEVRTGLPGLGAVSGSVLLVEDDDGVGQLVTRYLQQRGFSVAVARSGEEALERAPESLDLLVSDLVLPGISGIEVAKELAQSFPDLRVLFMSGYADPARQIPPGALFLAKPFTLDSLGRVLLRLLEREGAEQVSGRP